jgi:DNA-directed RNA polymerase I, II, and III subunit RPABC2
MSDDEYNDSGDSGDENSIIPKPNKKIELKFNENDILNDDISDQESENSDNDEASQIGSNVSEDEEDDDDDDDGGSLDDMDQEEGNLDDIENETNPKKETKKNKKKKVLLNDRDINSDDESEDGDNDDLNIDENYLQKFTNELKGKIIEDHHPELHQHNYEEIATLSRIVRDKDGIIVDPFHKTLPFMTKYEITKVIGSRAMQISAGGKPFIPLEENMIDSYLIALEELKQKKIPFIIKRPIPGGGSEYWNVKDLEII